MSLGVEKASIDLGRIFIWFWLELLQFWKEINSFGRKGPIGCEMESIHFETRSRDKESNWTGLNKPKPKWIHFLWKSNDLLPKSNGFLSQSIWCLSMDFLANEIKWGGHQFYFGRAIIWYGKKIFWFWQSIAWISEGELSLVKVINTFSFDFDTRPTEIQNAPIEFWKGLNWLGRNIDWLGKEFHWLLQNFQLSWTVTSWFERKPMHSDLFSKRNQLKF